MPNARRTSSCSIPSRRLIYHGRLDDSTPRNGVPVTGREMRSALDGVLGGTGVPAVQKPSIGCSIKWKSG